MQALSLSLLGRPSRAWIIAIPLALLSAYAAAQLASDEAAFNAENAAAMDKMMAGMNVHPSGDVDRDFAAMMIPHHQGAIDMALAELRHGRNEQLRRIAQEIIVEQQQEIDAMHLAVGEPPSSPAPAPTQAATAGAADLHDAASSVHTHHDH
jgi:hypothetical protein